MSTGSSSGHVAYEAMTNAQKAELAAYLREELVGDGKNAQWKSEMQSLIRESLARRAASGESVDAGDIMAEVLPRARAAIPESVREGLFRKVILQLDV